MTAVTIERIARLNALVRAAAHDTADEPAAEQDRLLVQACADTCRLLRDWLDSDEWSARRAPRRPQYPQAAGQDYLDLLDRALGDLLDRAAQLAGSIDLPALLVDDARAAFRRALGRHSPWGGRDLLDEARQRVTRLRNAACDLARRVPADGDGPDAQEWRARVRALLGWVEHLLPVLFLTIVLTVPPAEVEASLASWYHEATRVVATCLVAEYAPSAVIAPPELSPPRLEPPELEPPEMDIEL